MKAFLKLAVVISVASITVNVLAQQDLDTPLKETQNFMKDRQQVEALAEKDVAAKRANEAVNQAVGTGAEKDELLRITSEIMAVLANKHKGDVQAMQADLLNAMRDPKKFLESLPPEQKAQIRSLANTVEKKKTPKGVQQP